MISIILDRRMEKWNWTKDVPRFDSLLKRELWNKFPGAKINMCYAEMPESGRSDVHYITGEGNEGMMEVAETFVNGFKTQYNLQ